MNRTDRYILRQFVQTFLFGLLAFIVIFVVINLIENLDNFTDHQVPPGVIAKYYVFYTPEILKLVVPIAMLLAGLFTFGRLDSTHELTAIRSSGVSMQRIALPLIIFGFLVGSAMIPFSGWLVPETNAKKLEIDRKYLGANIIGGASNVFLRVSPTLNLQMDYFDLRTGIANTVSLERIDSAAVIVAPELGEQSGRTAVIGTDSIRGLTVVERIDAQRMEYDSAKGVWTMINGIARNLRDPELVAATPFERREIEGLPVTPHELNLSQQRIEELNLSQLKERIERERQGGRDVRLLEIEYHSKYSFPFAAFIVVFFGIPFTTAQRKGGAAIPIALTALISAVYLIFTEVSKTLSFTADVPPVATAWLANGIFLMIGLFNLWRVERT